MGAAWVPCGCGSRAGLEGGKVPAACARPASQALSPTPDYPGFSSSLCPGGQDTENHLTPTLHKISRTIALERTAPEENFKTREGSKKGHVRPDTRRMVSAAEKALPGLESSFMNKARFIRRYSFYLSQPLIPIFLERFVKIRKGY